MNNPATVPTASVLTLGCKVNQYESEAIAERLCALGFELRDSDDVCDVYIINTCAVTAEAERKSRQLIRRAYRKNANAHIIVCGCMTQSAPDNARLDGVDVIIGNKNKLAAADEALEAEPEVEEPEEAPQSAGQEKGFLEKLLDLFR